MSAFSETTIIAIFVIHKMAIIGDPASHHTSISSKVSWCWEKISNVFKSEMHLSFDR